MSNSEKISNLVESLMNLTVMDLVDLKESLEEKTGIKADSFAASAPSAAPVAAEAGAAAEKNTLNVYLTSIGKDKIGVIKVCKKALKLEQLKDAKKLVDLAVPSDAKSLLKENATKEEAESLKKEFSEVGAELLLE